MPGAQTSPEQLAYDVVDVFTDRTFAGNALAVVYGADGLSTDQLQAIAMEFNLSETTFPVTLTEGDIAAGADYRLRIFTPGGEIPFAGHPTLGSAWALRERGAVQPGARTQACGAGLIGVQIPLDSDDPVELSATPRDHARAVSASETAELAALVGLDADDVIGPGQFAGCGLTWAYLRVVPDAVGRAHTVGRALAQTSVDTSALRDPVDGVSVFAPVDRLAYFAAAAQGGDPPDVLVTARVFVPGFGIPEDPATGSAAAGLGLVLVSAGLAAPDGATSYRIEQGVAMGRPSLLDGRVEASDGVARLVRVAGQVVAVASGTIRVPPA